MEIHLVNQSTCMCVYACMHTQTQIGEQGGRGSEGEREEGESFPRALQQLLSEEKDPVVNCPFPCS